MSAYSGLDTFGPAYFHGRTGSNYLDYGRRQGQKIVWVPLLWIFSRIVQQHGKEPLAHVDVGCAFGYFVSYARRLVRRSVGVDVSPYAIARARALFPEIDFFEARAEQLPFADESFDIMTSFDTLEHLPDVGRALTEFRRVLRSGGTTLIRVPYAGFWRRCWGWRDRDTTHVSVLTWDAWKDAFARAGFTIERSLRYPTLTGGHVICLARKR